jgi:phosphonate transport system substrate-binding protein
MFADVNENDARAAMKVWIATVAQERGIPVDPNPQVFLTVEEVLQANRNVPLDGVGLVTPEFSRLCEAMKFDRMAVSIHGGTISEEYLLLVHQESGLERLEQLRGRTLNILQSPRMSLATIWLDTLLLQARQSPVADFFARTNSSNKVGRVALPVFFRQADACLLTRKSFQVMGELNPQIHQQLRILAFSPAFVPSGFALRADRESSLRAKVLTEMTRLNETPVGRQILTLTQADRIEERPISCLDSALELLATHARLGAARSAAPPKRESTPLPEPLK